MTEDGLADTRTRLLNAAADLIAAAPGEDFSLRAVCDAAGVKMPTLYHFFGSKQGLIDAVVERGFDMYLSAKSDSETGGDPIQQLRRGWDAHVAFGLENPGFYTLMYGKVRPGYSPEAQSRPAEMLRALTKQAEDDGRLVVGYEEAAAHIIATNIGVTLRQIILGQADPDLSAHVREGVLAAITGTGPAAVGSAADERRLGHTVIEQAAAHPEILGETETQLLIQWIGRLGEKTG